GADSLFVKGTTGIDTVAVTATTVNLTGAGLLTYANFESLDVDGLAGVDTLTVNITNISNSLTLRGFENASATVGTLSGTLTAFGGPITNSTVTSITATGLLEVSEQPPGLNAGLLNDSTIGTGAGRVLAGSIVNTKFTTIAAGGSVKAAGQGTTTNVSVGTLSGSFTAPEDGNAGSGVMSNTTIDSITSTGVVSTGSISGMTVGTAAGSITAAGQGTTSNVSIGTLSGSFTAPEDMNAPPGTPTGVMS